MIKVIALATASVQTTPTGWVCLLSDLTANVCHLLDVAWCFCSFLTFLKVNILENYFQCTCQLTRIFQFNVMLYPIWNLV